MTSSLMPVLKKTPFRFVNDFQAQCILVYVHPLWSIRDYEKDGGMYILYQNAEWASSMTEKDDT